MRYFWLVIFVLSVGSVSAQNSARVRELEKQRKAALAEIEMTSQLLDETRQTARNSLNRLNLLSKQILSRKQVISLLNQEIGEIDKQIAASRRNISQLEKELGNKRQNYGKSVQSIYKRRSSQDKLLFILSADNFAQSLRRMRYLREYADWQKKQASEIIGKQKEIVGKQKELLETLTGKAAVEASQKAIELIEKQADAARTLGKERLNAGASAGSHSIGVRMRKGMNNEGWAEWNNFANSIGMNPDDIGNRMTGLFDLTAEQLATLQRDAPTFWAKLDGDVREYLEQIIACNEETEEMRDLLNESLTQVSFDDVFSSFLDALSDMDSSSEEFANNFEKYMQKAILNSMLIDNYKSRINEWYKAFAKANESGGIDEKEYADLQESWNGIVSDALEERNALMQQFGWSSGEESSSQSSTQKGFAAMSQDTGDELNGRFTALQISNEEIKNSMLFVLGSLSSLCTTASDSNLLLTDMRNLAVMSNGHLEDIAKYTKVLLGFGEKLDNIDRNTKNI